MYPKKRRTTKRPMRSPGYRSGGSGAIGRMPNYGPQSMQMRVGIPAIKRNLTPQTMTTSFTATTSGVGSPINIWQSGTGNTEFLIAGTHDPSIRFSSTLRQVNYAVGGTVAVTPFYGADTWSDLYDYYRIDRVEVQCFVGAMCINDANTSINTIASIVSPSLLAQPVLVYAVDSGDANPVTTNQLLSFGNCQMKQILPNDPIEFSYKPAAIMDLGNAVGAPGAGPTFSPKIDSLTPQVDHFGFKMCALGMTALPQNTAGTATNAYSGLVTFVIRQYVTFFDRRTI